MEKSSIIREIAAQCHVPPGKIEDAYPCTPFQATAFGTTVGSPRVLYSHMTYRLDRDLAEKSEQLQSAIRHVHSHTPLLRTRIVNLHDGPSGTPRPMQAVLREEMLWTVFDDLETFNLQHRSQPLEYGDRLVHFAMSRCNRTFVMAVHHAVYDAWSLSLIWNDIRRVFRCGHSCIPVLRPPYSKFIAFLLQPLSASARHFWTSQYKGFHGPCYPKGRVLSHTNFRRTGYFRAGQPCSSDTSLTARVHTAWACMMMEMFRSCDVAYASAAMGRNCPVDGVLEMAGPTVCHVPFRGYGALQTSLRELMGRMQEQCRAGLEHEHAARPVFQSLVAEEQWPAFELNVITASQQIIPVDGMTPYVPENEILRHMWECKMEVVADEQDFAWELSGDTSRLSADLIEQVCRRFPQILQQILTLKPADETRIKDVVHWSD